ncbi:uncharacterized protein FPRO_16045 [Fusarium proliferatum ET1]|uniref:Glucose-methanol-choline oxidoreductase C-terminal domain-containing protein n=1 Tax=Fusarium proliferatum (strain ET1) TaxID=1227346 RepID=A0A1L7WB36_FUSPR|nr:uncharacterized protein FPRO_16045 [Fusarium proliferatum ET1]CZR49837.1 uncharacterized protein FPRO_16045 [Fusarium proliferatum ET1]
MGTDGRKEGSAVVDTNVKVYGMDNLFVADVGIHPDLATGDVEAIVTVAAEVTVAKILACQTTFPKSSTIRDILYITVTVKSCI